MADDTLVADPPPPAGHRAPSTTGDKVRFVIRGVGQTLITLGLVVLLFVVYEVWITSLFARADNDAIARKTETVWASGQDTLPGSGTTTLPLGTGIANIYIPRLGRDYHWTIVEGTGASQLEEGPGHYPGTAYPGRAGNFGVAGHRVGKGEPFLNLDKLRVGDAVVVETAKAWYVYRILGSRAGDDPQGESSAVETASGRPVDVPGREIVEPSAGRVLDPVPSHAGLRPAQKLMTMTTCHPKFTAARRMILHARLADQYPAAAKNGKRVTDMPASVQALYGQVGA